MARLSSLLLLLLLALPPARAADSAIFIHPDGAAANSWMAARLFLVGPDGRLAWDRLPAVAVYVGPTLDAVNQSSNAGATTHAYGLRVELSSYGTLGGEPIARSASGFPGSLMHEAQAAGKRVGIVNSSTLTEPGTGAFLARVPNRRMREQIVEQILASKPDVALGGGEVWFLPEGVQGRHGIGRRSDGRNLIDEARAAGYTVVFDADELAAVPEDTERLLGLFAAEETFNEGSVTELREAGLPVFQPQAPRFDVMVAAALRILRRSEQGYLLVANEEASDNLSGENNVPATIEALAGADRAIAIALEEAARNPRLTVIVASDSDNAGMIATSDDLDELPRPLPERTENGSPLHSDEGQPFLTAPDRHGNRLPFYITWASTSDSAGGLIARGIGPGAARIRGTIDATEIFHALHLGLFGEKARSTEQ